MVYFVCALKNTVFPLFFIMSYCFVVRIFATLLRREVVQVIVL